MRAQSISRIAVALIFAITTVAADPGFGRGGRGGGGRGGGGGFRGGGGGGSFRGGGGGFRGGGNIARGGGIRSGAATSINRGARPSQLPAGGSFASAGRAGQLPAGGNRFASANRPGQLPAGGNRINNGGNLSGNRGNRVNTGDINIDRNTNIAGGNWGNGNWDGGWGHWADNPVAAGVVVGAAVGATAAAAYGYGSTYYDLPVGCPPYAYGGSTYYSCGGAYYEPRYEGTSVTYVTVPPPESGSSASTSTTTVNR